MEEQATDPCGIILHLRLEANGILVESKGNVRVTYPYLVVGIAFEGMSEENPARLRRLLSKLSHPHVLMGAGVITASAHTETITPRAMPFRTGAERR